jgi:preprotein translocase subunit SecE
VAEDKPAQQKKRRVKSPETFRERAVKAAEAGDKPAPKTRLKTAGSQVTKPVVGPVRRAFSKVYNLNVMRPVRKVLHVTGRIIFPRYFRQSWQELKLVTWPNWKESRRLTFAVLVFAIVFGASIAGVDWLLDKVFRHLLIQ